MQVATLRFMDEGLEKPEYKIGLPLCISHKTLGVGSASCGQNPWINTWFLLHQRHFHIL